MEWPKTKHSHWCPSINGKSKCCCEFQLANEAIVECKEAYEKAQLKPIWIKEYTDAMKKAYEGILNEETIQKSIDWNIEFIKNHVILKKEVEKLNPESEAIYPCADCGVMRTKDEGGTTFTVCDKCWDKHYKRELNPESGLVELDEEVVNKLLDECLPSETLVLTNAENIQKHKWNLAKVICQRFGSKENGLVELDEKELYNYMCDHADGIYTMDNAKDVAKSICQRFGSKRLPTVEEIEKALLPGTNLFAKLLIYSDVSDEETIESAETRRELAKAIHAEMIKK